MGTDKDTGSAGDGNNDLILKIEQNDTTFTGERLVINKTVKKKYSDVLEEHLARYQLACAYVNGRKVLDAACGTGYGSYMLSEAGAAEVTGVDISPDSIAGAMETYRSENISFRQGDINKLPFADGSFDAVISFETIEHIENGRTWIAESARLLKPNGIFIVSTPNRSVTNVGSFYEEQPMNRFHRHECNLYEFTGWLLEKYSLAELYGQTFIRDNEFFTTKIARQARHLDLNKMPDLGTDLSGHRLIPLSEVKNASPMYLTAVCRQK